MKKYSVLLFLLMANIIANGQAVGIGTSTPNASAQLDITSTTKGLLLPRMTAAQRGAIASPAAGLMVYETTSTSIWIYNGSSWVQLASGGASPWTVSAANIYNSNAGNVGIGISTPLEKLHLVGDFKQDNGTVTLNNAGSIIQFQNAGVSKSYVQLSGDNLRMGTNGGNQFGKAIFRMAGTDRVLIDSTGNIQVLGLQDVSLTNHGYLTLGSLTGDNLIFDAQEIQARNNGNADDMVMQNEGGNVGIGVFPPADKLDVNGSARLTGGGRVLKFETGLAGGMINRYVPGIRYIRSDGTILGAVEYVDTLSFANFIRIRMGENYVNGITLNTSNHTGLGTAEPLGRLHVRGATGIDEIAVNSGNFSESATIQFYNSFASGEASTKRVFIQLDDYDLKMGANSGNSTGSFIVRMNGTDRVFVTNAGNVGIGDATPSGRLHVACRTYLNNGSGEALALDGTNPYLQFYQSGVSRSFIQQSGTTLFMGVNGGKLRLDATQIAIGNVLNTADNYKLAVTGKIICEELKVELSGTWPDYVFADNYKLRSLDELNTFIKTNKHLPNIPAAAELEKNGMEVGDMQKRMMEKIEELTLYILELKSEVDSMKKNK